MMGRASGYPRDSDHSATGLAHAFRRAPALHAAGNLLSVGRRCRRHRRKRHPLPPRLWPVPAIHHWTEKNLSFGSLAEVSFTVDHW